MSETTDCLTQLEDSVRAAVEAGVPEAKRVVGPEDFPLKEAFLPAIGVDIGDDGAPVYLGHEEGGDRLRVRGDELVACHDAEAGRRGTEALERATAGQIAQAFEGTVEDLCKAVRDRVPSAKPCRMQGMNSQKVRTQLRAGDIGG